MLDPLGRKLVATDPRVHCLSQETPLFEISETRQTRQEKTHTFITTSYVLSVCSVCWLSGHTAREVYWISVHRGAP
jgi:hypothetical protein